MKILIASIMFLFLLVSVEPAFSHSGGRMILDAMQVASLIIVMTKMTMGVLSLDRRIPMKVLY